MHQQPTRVLYISYDGMTDALGQSQVLPYLCGLSNQGFQITLLSAEKPQRFSQYRKTIEAICQDAGITWQPLMYTASPPVLSTLKDVAALHRKAAQLHRERNFKIVHCRSYIAALAGMRMKEQFGIRFLFDMRGFWADERVDGSLWNTKRLLYRLIYKYFKKKETLFLQKADHIISLTNAGKNEMESWQHLHRKPLPVTVIPCCVDTRLFDPARISEVQKQALKKQLGIAQSQLLVGYTGSIGTWYLASEMLSYFKTVREQQPDAKMLFVTNEPASAILSLAVEKGIPQESIIVRSATREEMPLYISMMSYSIFFIKPAFSKIASSPTKQGEIMAMGIPVICNARVGDSEDVVRKYNSGIVISEFSDEAYQKAAKDILLCDCDSKTIRNGALDFYSLEKGIALYASVYHQLTSLV